MASGTVRVIDQQARVTVTDETPVVTVVPAAGNEPTLVVEEPVVRVVTQGVQGPPGPSVLIPGSNGDVFFKGNSGLEVATGVFAYVKDQQALSVSKIIGASMDGGNF